jgi:serine/threonine protein phosphatase PrpC
MFETFRGQRAATDFRASVYAKALPSSMLEIEFAELSDNGRVRPHNEDFVGHLVPATPEEARSHGWLFVLADGVGGQQQGEVASKAAVECILQGFRAAGKNETPTALLQRLVQSANARVFDVAVKAGPEGAGMATTLVACALRYDRAIVAHVGDSRCYLIRRGEAQVLTRDHTVASEHAALGLLTAEEAEEADTRHVLSRSLGGGLFVGIDVNDHQVFAGDVLLLCSDGLHGAVRGPQMAEVVGTAKDLGEAARRLVELANEQDGGDNVSVQLVGVRSVERVGMYRGRPYKLR